MWAPFFAAGGRAVCLGDMAWYLRALVELSSDLGEAAGTWKFPASLQGTSQTLWKQLRLSSASALGPGQWHCQQAKGGQPQQRGWTRGTR